MDTARSLVTLLLRAVRAFARDECGLRAAAISYYVLFSIFPLLIFSVGIVGLFLQDAELQEEVVDTVMKNIPLDEAEGRNDIQGALRDIAGERGGAIGFVGLLGLAWSSGAMFGAVRRSLNVVFGAERARPLVQQRLFDLLMVLTFAPFFLASIAATAASRAAAAASEDIPILGSAAQDVGLAWDIASLFVPAMLSFAAFFALYWRVPARTPSPRQAAAGALAAALLFESLKFGFGVYLENFGNYDLVFGPLSAAVAFLAWVYFSATVLLLGAEVAASVSTESERESNAMLKPRTPFGQRLRAFLLSLVLERHSELRGHSQIDPEDESQQDCCATSSQRPDR